MPDFNEFASHYASLTSSVMSHRVVIRIHQHLQLLAMARRLVAISDALLRMANIDLPLLLLLLLRPYLIYMTLEARSHKYSSEEVEEEEEESKSNKQSFPNVEGDKSPTPTWTILQSMHRKTYFSNILQPNCAEGELCELAHSY
jgi:Ca2+/Na+ antiporter